MNQQHIFYQISIPSFIRDTNDAKDRDMLREQQFGDSDKILSSRLKNGYDKVMQYFANGSGEYFSLMLLDGQVKQFKSTLNAEWDCSRVIRIALALLGRGRAQAFIELGQHRNTYKQHKWQSVV